MVWWLCACVCVYVLRCDREEGGGVRGLSRKAIKPFKSHKVLGQSKPPPARHLMSSTVCASMCVSYVCVEGASEPVWRISGILGSKRERKGERKKGCTTSGAHENSHRADAEWLERNVSGYINVFVPAKTCAHICTYVSACESDFLPNLEPLQHDTVHYVPPVRLADALSAF